MNLGSPFRWLSGLALLACPGCLRLDLHAPDGDSFAELRERMVTEQIMGPGRGVADAEVLRAMRTVPRHRFVPDSVRAEAYADRPLPIGYGQTISQPLIVAFMSELLDVRPGTRVLEVGTGSGYQAAVLAELGAEVWSVEILEPLAQRARQALEATGYAGRVRVRLGDGYRGWPEAAPFDRIIVTCSPEEIPQPLIQQLADGGRMVIPVGDRGVQQLVMLEKIGGEVRRRSLLPVQFVPMTGEAQRGPAW